MGMLMKNGVPYASGSEIPEGGTKGQVLAKASNINGDFEWKDVGGGTGGNADFDVSILPLGPTGMHEVRSQVSNGDDENSNVVYSRGANGELPQWFSMGVKSTLGGDTFQVATKEFVDTKQDKLTSGTNIKTVNGNSLLGQGNLEIGGSGTVDAAMSDTSENAVQNKVIKAYVDNVQGLPGGGTNGQILAKNSMSPDNAEWIDNPIGTHIEINKEKWYGTYTDENGVTYQVYSKMIYIPALPSTAGTTTYQHGVSGIKQILQVYGFTTDGFVLNAPRQNAQDNIAIYQMSKSASNQTLSIEVGKDRSNKSAYVVMVYAKNN